MGKRGITLIETICVLAIISIIITVVMPSITLIEHLSFNQKIDQLHTGIVNARQMARATNNTHVIMKMTYTIGDEKNGLMIKADGASPMNEVYEFPSYVEVKIGDKETTKEYNIEFYGDNSSLKAGAVTLKNHRLGKQVQITVRPVTGTTAIYETDLN